MSNPSRLFAFLIVGILSVTCCGVAQAELVAYWDFEEGSGTTTRDQINMNDDPLTDATWVTDPGSLPPIGTTAALDFNGTSSVVDTAYEGIGGSDPRTIALWVKLADVTDEAVSQGLVSYGGRAANGQKWHFRVNDGGDPRVRGAIRTEAQGGNQTGTTNIADGQWHHVASVFPGGVDADNIDVIHYVDGILEGETGATDEPIDTTVGGDLPRITIGARRQDGNSVFDSPLSSFLTGTLDDVRIYDHALTQGEIQALVPEPSAIILGGLGFFTFLAFGSRRNRRETVPI